VIVGLAIAPGRGLGRSIKKNRQFLAKPTWDMILFFRNIDKALGWRFAHKMRKQGFSDEQISSPFAPSEGASRNKTSALRQGEKSCTKTHLRS
jgi:hypothetical protein